MPDSLSTAETVSADESAVQPRRRRRAIIASGVVGSLVLATMVWGGTTAAQAVATERRLEAARVADLGLLLDTRSSSTELLAATAAVIGTAGETAPVAPEAHAALVAAHEALVLELDRALDRETPLDLIVAQSRLLSGDLEALIDSLDAHTRAVVDHARAARAAAPLATAATLAALDAALAELAVVPQGLPSSYSGRAVLVADVLTTTAAVTASHVAAKAEQERLAAERAAAEAARGSGGGSSDPLSAFREQMKAERIAAGCILLSETPTELVWDCPPEYWDNLYNG